MTKKEITAIANDAVAETGVREVFEFVNTRRLRKNVPYVRLTYKKGTFECSWTVDNTTDVGYARRSIIDLIVYRHNRALREARKKKAYA